VEEMAGESGKFRVKIRKKARSVNAEKCTGCGDCWTHCPIRFKAYISQKGGE
jgi:heterodisulfide reductase subunit A